MFLGSLPRYDQVHGSASTRGRPQLPSYTASPTPEPPTSPTLEEDQTRVTSLEEIHIAAMDGVKSSTMKKLVNSKTKVMYVLTIFFFYRHYVMVWITEIMGGVLH